MIPENMGTDRYRSRVFRSATPSIASRLVSASSMISRNVSPKNGCRRAALNLDASTVMSPQPFQLQ